MGSLGSLTELRLSSNQIGDEGIKAFSSAVASGSLANLRNIMINNPSQALCDICTRRDIYLPP